MLDQERDVLTPLSQGERDDDDRQAVIEVGAKLPLADFGGEIAIGCGHDANVEPNGTGCRPRA